MWRKVSFENFAAGTQQQKKMLSAIQNNIHWFAVKGHFPSLKCITCVYPFADDDDDGGYATNDGCAPATINRHHHLLSYLFEFIQHADIDWGNLRSESKKKMSYETLLITSRFMRSFICFIISLQPESRHTHTQQTETRQHTYTHTILFADDIVSALPKPNANKIHIAYS